MDLFAKTRSYSVPADMKNAGLYPYFIPFSSGMEPEAEAAGRRVLMFGSNNYLGLTTHPAVVNAAT